MEIVIFQVHLETLAGMTLWSFSMLEGCPHYKIHDPHEICLPRDPFDQSNPALLPYNSKVMLTSQPPAMFRYLQAVTIQ